jgi:hypothetical protein
MSIVVWLSGFLYLLILVLQIFMAVSGYILEPKQEILNKLDINFNHKFNFFICNINDLKEVLRTWLKTLMSSNQIN